MTFTVTYRGADGALREEAVEAAGRAECFAQMKARGIVPVSVKEGASLGERASRPFRSRAKTGPRNAQDARCPSGGGKPKSSIFNLKSSIILAAVLAVAGGAWWWLAARENKRPPVEKPRADKGVKDLRIPEELPRSPIATNAVAGTNLPPAETATIRGSRSGQPSPPTSSNAVIRPRFFKPTVTLEDGTVVDLRPAPAIKDPMERALAAVATPGGMAIPFAAALRRFSREELMEMLARDVEFSKDDSEAVVEKKVAVQQVKDMFRAYLKEGRSLEEAILSVDRQMKIESMRQAAAYKGLATAVKSGDGEFVNKYVEEQNRHLQEQGLRLLTVPPQFKVSTESKEKQR